MFTKRPVQAGEELTFDYQFQTFGKKRHKCYCGSEKCRGYLGQSSSGSTNNNVANPTLDYIWEEGSSSDDEDEDDNDSGSDEVEEEEDDDGKSDESADALNTSAAANSKRHKDNMDFDVITSFKTANTVYD